MDSSILTVLNKIGEVGRFAVGEYQRLQDVDNQVVDLRSKLEFLMAWIQVAEEGNRIKGDQLVSVWVNQLRGAVSQAEDIVDEYFQAVYQSRPGYETKDSGRWPCVPCFPLSEVPLRYDLAAQIMEVLAALDKIQERDSLFNVQPRVEQALASNTISALDKPTIHSLAVDDPWRADAIVGFDGYVKDMIEMLLNDHGKQTATVAVMGVSGIGKTTAARAVFQDCSVQRHFDVCAWACLPPKSRVDSYMDVIWQQAQKQTHCDCPCREDMKQVLGKMKFLVVLDGLDSMDELMDVLRELPDGAMGSRIVVTTQLQSAEIERVIHDFMPVKIKCLERPDCLGFLDRVFSGRCGRVYQENRSKFGDKIYDISEGIPLAVVLLGGLLYFKDHEAQWNEVFELLQSFQHLRLIKRILTVSYATMPTILKLCLLYFAAMPLNVHHDLKKLHRLWCAEGIPESEIGGDFTEDVVLDRCIRVLVSRGLVQRLEDGAKVCIHQSVHSFAQAIARKTGFMESDIQFDIRGASTVRRLSIHNYADTRMHMDKCFPKLRTFLGDFAEDCVEEDEVARSPRSQAKKCFCLKKQCVKQSRLEFICQSKFLRVLDMHGVKLGMLPHSIGHMIHLRYLGLRSCSLKDLPPSVAKLVNLETLDITDNEIRSIVDEFWKIEKLKHVFAQKLLLPVSAASMDLARNLESLHGVTPSSTWTQRTCPIKNMWKLFRLDVVGATPENVRPLATALEDKRALRQVTIAGDCIPLLCSSRYQPLQYLELDGKVKLDEGAAHRYPITASVIVLRSSCMSQKLLDSFLSQAVLNELELLDNSFSGLNLLLQGPPFRKLTKLKLGNLDALEELVIGDGAVPELIFFEMFGCPNIKTIQGLKNSGKIRSVVFFDMPDIVSQIEAEDKQLFARTKHVTTAAWARTT